MKILVTGGLGFIGHNVVRVLESFRHEVAIIDNKTTYGIIPPAELDYLILERLCRINTRNITVANIEDPFDDSIFEGVDVVNGWLLLNSKHCQSPMPVIDVNRKAHIIIVNPVTNPQDPLS